VTQKLGGIAVKALIGSLLVAFVAAGCMPVSPGTSTESPSSAPPAATDTPTPPPTTASTPSPSPTDDETPLPAPPTAGLTAGEAEPIAGDLGTVCWLGGCGDGPWLPAPGLPLLEVEAGDDQLKVTIEDGFEFVQWSAEYADAQDTTGDDTIVLDRGGSEEGPSMIEAAFDAPPPGDWVVSVYLVYANSDGNGAYYWHVTVP
jgi:hypothetical protein